MNNKNFNYTFFPYNHCYKKLSRIFKFEKILNSEAPIIIYFFIIFTYLKRNINENF